eukprot:GHRR01014339.1.p1 GENE.GHRR01014339.1~~GHRR01014339.1.p1  ORF type:complete len:324 (+),score=132.93 GHRR01014339.1:1948-2919(+)
MAKLRAAEAAAASATAERDELQMALEEHKGPWMDEVHKGVEQRVREALTRAEQLERQEEVTAKQHAARVSHLLQQQADLEVVLQEARQREAELKQQLQAERVTAAEAHIAAEEASALAAEAQATADARAADLRVAQDSLRAMREECNERWMSERTARAQLAEQQSGLDNLTLTKAQLQQALEERTDELSTQRAVNQQLMLKKEETEWQLMAAIAKVCVQSMSCGGVLYEELAKNAQSIWISSPYPDCDTLQPASHLALNWWNCSTPAMLQQVVHQRAHPSGPNPAFGNTSVVHISFVSLTYPLSPPFLSPPILSSAAVERQAA